MDTTTTTTTTMARVQLLPGERILEPTWSVQIVVLSFLVSWLGAFTSSQVLAQADVTRRGNRRLLWLVLASATFGWQTIWSLHFLATIAVTFDVPVSVDPVLTVVSALVATVFTFAAVTSDGPTYRDGWLYRLRIPRLYRRFRRRVKKRFPAMLSTKRTNSASSTATTANGGRVSSEQQDADDEDDEDYYDDDRAAEEGLLSRSGQVRSRGSEDETSSGTPSLMGAPHSHSHSHSEGTDARSVEGAPPRRPTYWDRGQYENEIERGRQLAGDAPVDAETLRAAGLDSDNELDEESALPVASAATPPLRSSQNRSRSRQNGADPSGPRRSAIVQTPPVAHNAPAHVNTNTITGTGTNSSRRSSSASYDFSSSDSTPNNTALGAELSLGLSRQAKKRLVSGAYRTAVGPKAFALEIYHGFSRFIAAKGIVWGAAIVSMHHLGILALRIPQGRVIWSPYTVAASCVVAWLVTCVASICILRMEVQFGRQMLFSTVAALGVFTFHYTSVFFGATFVSAAPPDPNGGGYPPEIAFSITALAILTCGVASGMLAQNAVVARNRLAELILTKRRMWRLLIEKEAVDRASELKQSFISVASHELRTPLFSVTGYVELLARTELSEEQDMYLANVQQACQNMALIISNVLDFSKLERNNAESTARPVRVSPRTMLEGLTRMTEDRNADRSASSSAGGVDVIVSVGVDVPETVFLDEAYLVRVLINLLSNALKFTASGFILVDTCMNPEGKMVVKVQDSGTGIPKKFRKALFEPYRQADSSLTRPHEGTGLGLSICKQLVQRLDGTIDVDSVEGEGTTFTVTLPVASPSDPPPSEGPSSVAVFSPGQTTSSPKTGQPAAAQDKRICLARSNPKSAQVIRSLLAAGGYTVTSSDAKSPLQLREGSDIIWTDVDALNKSPILRSLLRTSKAPPPPASTTTTKSASAWPYILVTVTPKTDVGSCEGLLQASNVVLVKTPGIVLHRLIAVFADPASHVGTTGAHGPAAAGPLKVRFALPSPTHSTASSSSTIRPPDPSPDLVEVELPGLGKGSPKEADDGGPVVILLVEDNAVNRLLGKRLLEKMGFVVETAENGEEAVEVARKGRCKVVLMDCQMPVMDGMQATRVIRQLEASGEMIGPLPIIALTANVTVESEIKCRESGMTDFLPKPLKLADLKAAIERNLHSVGQGSL